MFKRTFDLTRHVTVRNIMHQSIPPAPSLPPTPPPRPSHCGAFARLVSLGVGHLQILHCTGAGHLPTPGPFPSFWHAHGFLSEYNYTEGFTGKKKQVGLSVKDRNKLKRVVKACSRLYACISSLLIKPKLHSEIGAIDVDQRFLVIESNFCWDIIWSTSFHIYKAIHIIKLCSALLI